MASLGEMYTRALADDLAYQRGWIPNWPPSFPVELGRVGEIVHDHKSGIVSLEGNNKLTDYEITPGPAEDGPVLGPRTFSWGSETKVKFEVNAKLPGWGWLAIAGAHAGFKASFGHDGGMQAESDNPQHHGLPDTDGLRKALREAGKNGKIEVGKSIVVELESADKAMIVASESSSGALQVSTSADVQAGGVRLANFALGCNVYTQTGKALVQPYPNRITTAFKALTIGTKGIWWWRRIDVSVAAFGGDAARLRSTLQEDELTADDYYVMY
jgi:hypothetical protein